MRAAFGAACHLVEGSAAEFRDMRGALITKLKTTTPINRGTWHSEDVSDSDAHAAHELLNVVFCVSIPSSIPEVQSLFCPDLPWAEDHFQERVSRHPMNPAPSYRDWPYHSEAERDRYVRDGGTFDHTYPERFWPKRANPGEMMMFRSGRAAEVNTGIRFAYGDLDDVVRLLQNTPHTRQAYLPVFFPEDTGSADGQRVPCTLGYHFIRNGMGLDCNYFIRSCDVYRHFTNDAYMGARLTQWIVQQLYYRGGLVWPGSLNMHVSNLHLFKGDSWRFQNR